MQHICRTPIPPPGRFDLMAFFNGFFDESGKHQAQRVVSFSGFVDSQWGPFEIEWEYLLRKHKKPNGIHLSKEDLKARGSVLKVYAEFVRAIKKTVEHGFSIAVDVGSFGQSHKIIRSHYRDDPHYLAFYTVMRDVVKYAGEGSDPAVSIICDDEPSKACECYKMFDVMRQNSKQPENRATLKSITFGDSKFYYGLQAADLFAWVCRAESLHRFFGESYSLRELFSEFNMDSPNYKTEFTAGFWSASQLKELEEKCIEHTKSKKR